LSFDLYNPNFDKSVKRCGMVIVGDSILGLLNKKPQGFLIPMLVDHTIDLPACESEYEAMLNKTSRHDYRKSLRNYKFVISTDIGDVDSFLNDFHRNTMKAAYPDEAIIISRRDLLAEISRGAFFCKIYDLSELCVAVALMSTSDDFVRIHRLGILNGDYSKLKNLCFTAIYSSAVRYAIKMGKNKVILGASSSIIESGLFKFKAKWQSVSSQPLIYNVNARMLINAEHYSVVNFFENNTQIIFDEGEYSLLGSAKSSAAAIKALKSNAPGWSFKHYYSIASEAKSSRVRSLPKWFPAQARNNFTCIL
jgi:hypothetical protein